MLQSSLFWNKLDVPDPNTKNIEDDQGRGGHGMFFANGDFYIVGGEQNTAKNWMMIKEQSRKAQAQMNLTLEDQNRKRSQSTQPTPQNNTGGMGFSLNGNRGGANKNLPVMDNYQIFNLENKQWDKKKAKGRFPTQRCFFATYYEYPYFFIHGGQAINPIDKKNKSQADTYFFDATTQTWKKFFVFDQPTARDQHSLTKIGKHSFYLFGGNISPENLLLDEMWTFSTENIPYTTAKQLDIPGLVWEKVIYTPAENNQVNLPGKLRGHKVVAHPDQRHLILFGGQLPDFQCSNKLFYFDTESRQWRLIETKGQQPLGRCHHTMLMLGDSMIVVFGGISEESNSAFDVNQVELLNDLHILNLKEMHWVQPITGGITPSPRYGHYMTPGEESNKVYVFGGVNEKFDFAQIDFFLLYETSKQSDKNWKIVEDLDLNTELVINLEKAEREYELQRQKIAELEDNIKRVEEEKIGVEADIKRIDNKLERVSSEIDDQTIKWSTYLGSREQLRNREIQFQEQVKQLVDAEFQYRKFFQEKCVMLIDTFKNMENLMINIDKAVVQVLDKDDGTLMDETISQEFKKIEKERINHRNCLVELSQSFNKFNSEEEELQRRISQLERQADIDRVKYEEEEERRKVKRKNSVGDSGNQ